MNTNLSTQQISHTHNNFLNCSKCNSLNNTFCQLLKTTKIFIKRIVECTGKIFNSLLCRSASNSPKLQTKQFHNPTKVIPVITPEKKPPVSISQTTHPHISKAAGIEKHKVIETKLPKVFIGIYPITDIGHRKVILNGRIWYLRRDIPRWEKNHLVEVYSDEHRYNGEFLLKNLFTLEERYGTINGCLKPEITGEHANLVNKSPSKKKNRTG